MWLFLLGLFSAFCVTFVTSSATTVAKRLFSEKQKPLPDTPENVIVVVLVFII